MSISLTELTDAIVDLAPQIAALLLPVLSGTPTPVSDVFVIPEEESVTEAQIKKMKKSELVKYLKDQGVEFNKNTKKPELQALALKTIRGGTQSESDDASDEEVEEVDEVKTTTLSTYEGRVKKDDNDVLWTEDGVAFGRLAGKKKAPAKLTKTIENKLKKEGHQTMSFAKASEFKAFYATLVTEDADDEAGDTQDEADEVAKAFGSKPESEKVVKAFKEKLLKQSESDDDEDEDEGEEESDQLDTAIVWDDEQEIWVCDRKGTNGKDYKCVMDSSGPDAKIIGIVTTKKNGVSVSKIKTITAKYFDEDDIRFTANKKAFEQLLVQVRGEREN